MRTRELLCGILLAAAPAWAACSGGDTSGNRARETIRDWGLHRAWAVFEDCAHPERPARLKEIAWTAETANPAKPRDAASTGQSRTAVAAEPFDVQAGMRVQVWRRNSDGEMRLTGTALAAGRRGERVRVRAGLENTVLSGIVRGPGLVELTVGLGPEKGWR